MGKKDLNHIAKKIRQRIIKLGYLTGKNGALFGSSLSLVEILLACYKSDDKSIGRRIVLSKGHGALGLFSCLEILGLMEKNETAKFEKNGSNIFAHAHKSLKNKIEYSGGSLGLGLPYALGIAISNQRRKVSEKIITILGDGECDEGIIWESLMSAAHFKVKNFCVIVDKNNMQSDGQKEKVLNQLDLCKKFKAFGFNTFVVDGHSIYSLIDSINISSKTPVAIIANTVKGKGVSFMENDSRWHHNFLSEDQYNKALSEILS